MSIAERIQIAQDLHDGVAQDLVGVGYAIDSILATPETPNQVREDLRTLRFDVSELIEKMRSEIYSLRSASVEEQLRNLEDEVCLLTADMAGEISIQGVELSESVCANICRIAIELVRNATLHSRGSHIDLRLWQEEDFTMLEVADNGVGGALEKSDRYGITGLHERASHIGGELKFSSTASGTQATLTIRR